MRFSHPQSRYRRSLVPTLGVVAAVASQFAAAPVQAAFINMDLSLTRTISGGSDYLSGNPFVYVPPDSTEIVNVSSDDGSHTGEASSGFNSASSAAYNSVEDLLTSVQSNPWNLSIRRANETVEEYQFNVDATDLAANLPALPGVTISNPSQGSTGHGLRPTISWSVDWGGLAPFEDGSANLVAAVFRLNGGSYTAIDSQNLSLDSTSWVPSVDLVPNSPHLVGVYYTKNVSDLVFISTPLDGEGNSLPDDWSAGATIGGSGFSTFTTVPEPGHMAVAIGAVMAAFAVGRRLTRRA